MLLTSSMKRDSYQILKSWNIKILFVQKDDFQQNLGILIENNNSMVYQVFVYYNHKILQFMQQIFKQCNTPVLLVCVYNKSGILITHDLFYNLFSQYGEVYRVLIFQKAKVWKTFVQMDSISNAQVAYKKLNNKTILSDGSKMNIFPSNLRQINFQNSNLGGVDYTELKRNYPYSMKEYEKIDNQENLQNRKKSNTHWAHQIFQPTKNRSIFSDIETSESPIKSQLSWNSESQRLSQKEFGEEKDDLPIKIRKRQQSWNNWCDVDAQFKQLALESSQYRQLIESNNRPKSKTIIPINPNLQQYLFQNNPSKVLFLRSLPSYHTIKTIYNIFVNFGNIKKIIHIKNKQSMLLEFEHIQDATQAKDFLNCVKNSMKIFFSHYENLDKRVVIQSQQVQTYNISMSKKENFNPPSQVLHITYLQIQYEQEFFEKCSQYGTIVNYSWQKLPNLNKWMLLMKMQNIEQSLKIMGNLQNMKIGSKSVKISFTRSKLQ